MCVYVCSRVHNLQNVHVSLCECYYVSVCIHVFLCFWYACCYACVYRKEGKKGGKVSADN